MVHKRYNPRCGIRVIVVSGEDLLDGFSDQNMYDAWPGTLVRIAQKSDLKTTLARCLKELRRDPLAQHLRRAQLSDVLEQYDHVIDAGLLVGERLKAARALAPVLVRNEVDHHNGMVGASNQYADDLNRLIKDQVESRFGADQSNRKYIDIGRIHSDGGLSVLLWRGATVQHLYTLHNYRNIDEHLRQHPFDGGTSIVRQIPREAMEPAQTGQAAAVIAEQIVRELLDWYLPWHEDVYLPWVQTQS